MSVFEPSYNTVLPPTNPGLPSDIDTIALWNFTSLEFNFTILLTNGRAAAMDNDVASSMNVHSTYWDIVLETNTQNFNLDPADVKDVIGSNGGDWLVGNAGDNLLVGLGDAGGLTGVGGLAIKRPSDAPFGRFEKDLGHNQIDGGLGDDILMGDLGIGDGAIDRLDGGEGEDILDSGIGKNDELTGGGDSDLFVFNNSRGTYRIMDFEDGIDAVLISGEPGLDFSGLQITQNDFNTEVRFGDTLIVFEFTNPSELDQNDFMFN